MRCQLSALGLALLAGGVAAQQSVQIPNAIGIWNSSATPGGAWGGVWGSPPGNYVDLFQPLPAELTTYFGSQAAGGKRELVFRGFEMLVTYGLWGSAPSYATPQVEIHDSLPFPQQPLRWIPGPTTYASFASIPGVIPGNLGMPTIVISADLGPGNGIQVPAGNPSGGALMMVWRNYQSSGPVDLWAQSSSNEPANGTPDAFTSYSGSYVSWNGQYQLLPIIGVSGTFYSYEYCWTWLFENSLIQPVRGATLLGPTGQILGGTPNPIPFAVQYDDGRGALHPKVGDAISFTGNSKQGNPAPGAIGTTWFVPFVLRSGDLAGGTNPPPEAWNSGSFAVDATPVWKWLDDFCAFSGACPTSGVGSIVNPANSTFGMWMGLRLPTFQNLSVLLDNLQFADVSQGPLWAGPSTLAYNSTTNPAGQFGRNLIGLGGGLPWFTATGSPFLGICEQRSILHPQAGYTPLVSLPGGTLGFGAVPPGLSGSFVGIQCWMLDTITMKIVDVTNVAVARIQ